MQLLHSQAGTHADATGSYTRWYKRWHTEATDGMATMRVVFWGMWAAIGLVACGSYPAPNDKMAQTVAAARSADELGARKNAQAELHLKLAQEQLADAKRLMTEGENKRAELVLLRANADAELAVMLAREATMRAEATKAQDDLRALRKAD